MKVLIFFTLSLLLSIPNIIYGYTAGKVPIETSHFVIWYEDDEFDPYGNMLPDYADLSYVNNIIIIVEQIWSYLKGQGYKNPLNVPDSPPNRDRKLRIEIENRPIGYYGETTILGKDTSLSPGIPEIGIDNNYSEPGWEISGLDALRITLIHEIFHAVQQNYANRGAYAPSILDWFWEGTAVWIEDENVVLAGKNIDEINSYLEVDEYFLNYPELSLVERIGVEERYGVAIFFKYFTEKGYSIREVLERYNTLNPFSADTEKIPKNDRAYDCWANLVNFFNFLEKTNKMAFYFYI
jgi:hypothetical protein